MDLLNENKYNEPKQPKGKKTIIILLVLSIIAMIGIICIMLYIEANKEIEQTLFINDKPQKITEELIISDQQGNQYISLKELSSILGYEYYSGEYKSDITDSSKCYIKNKNLISGFQLGSNEIYKYEEGTNLDYQYYQLKYNITAHNNKIYIAISDLGKGVNVYCSINEKKEIKISTMEHLFTLYQERLKERGFSVATDQNNQKALAYGWVIVNKNDVYGVLKSNLEEIIDVKYSSLYFDEKNNNYIVSNSEGKYGIISTSGTVDHSFKYDGLEILNYENMLYKVEDNKKYGIMKADGRMLTEIEYDQIGYQAEPSNKILYTLIIPNIDEKSGPVIIVKKDKYYGLVSLKTGEILLPCDHVEKIYSINELGEIVYKVYVQEQTMGLKEYLDLRKKQTLQLN